MTYCLRVDPDLRKQLETIAASTGLPTAELFRIGANRLIEQCRRDGGLVLPLQSEEKRA
jgi:hypothetical protein